jgi:hypothetical protein
MGGQYDAFMAGEIDYLTILTFIRQPTLTG